MIKKVHMISLGCPKNRVDSEVMVGLLNSDEAFEVVADIDEADVVVVNTCGFIDAAKEESVDTILEMTQRKADGLLREVVVTGCLSQRYHESLVKEIPEVDTYLGTNTFTAINDVLHGRVKEKALITPGSFIMDANVARPNTIRGGTAYLKISEGCSRSCSFCAIPGIRGKQVSRTLDDVVKESRKLVDSGVKEIILLAQDMTSYGIDLDPKNNRDYLIRLLRRLDGEIEDLSWLRLLYMYPWNFTDELLDVFTNAERLLPYIDMPLQHVSQKILKSMRRNIKREKQMDLIDRIRDIEDMVLRTTFIVGYPGESDKDFQELYDWVEHVEFDRVGVFTFSPEENTLAATLDEQVEEHVKQERYGALMELQRGISARKNRDWIGSVTEVIVDGISEEHELVFQGRHYGQAPDIDGVTFLSSEHGGKHPTPGDILTVQIEQATDYDLLGIIIPDKPLDLSGAELSISTSK